MSLDIRRTIWLIRGSPLTYWERPPEYSRSQRHLGTGALLETFAVSELVRQAARFADDLGIGLFHYRAPTGSEIDVTAETDDGRVVGIEIKASTSVREEDFSHLAAVRDRRSSFGATAPRLPRLRLGRRRQGPVRAPSH